MKTSFSRLIRNVSLLTLFMTNAQAFPVACQSLTPAAITNPITLIDSSIAQAEIDLQKNGVTGRYPGAPKLNRDDLLYAKNIMVKLQSWLKANGLDSPYVTNASASYNVYLSTADAIRGLHSARHWAAVSTSWNRAQAARNSIDLTTQAIYALEKLGTQATVCYVDRLAPFK